MFPAQVLVLISGLNKRCWYSHQWSIRLNHEELVVHLPPTDRMKIQEPVVREQQINPDEYYPEGYKPEFGGMARGQHPGGAGIALEIAISFIKTRQLRN